MVRYLVEGTTSSSATMPTVTLIHTQTFIAATTQYQVEYRTGKQSWLGLTGSHPMRWRCFISAESHDLETRQLLKYQLFLHISFIDFLYVAVLKFLYKIFCYQEQTEGALPYCKQLYRTWICIVINYKLLSLGVSFYLYQLDN